jgi:hypothetical protein
MKKLFFLLALPLCFAACTNNTTTTTTTVAPADTTAAVTLPYTATYSSTFVPGKQTDVLTVLNSYKAWETGDMAGLKATCADSVSYVFPSGFVFNNTLDSFMTLVTKYRDSLSGVKIKMYAWTSNHSVDKNEDWVNVWYEETDTYKMGKVDSVNFEDDNLLKNGKIVWTSSHEQKFKTKM